MEKKITSFLFFAFFLFEMIFFVFRFLFRFFCFLCKKKRKKKTNLRIFPFSKLTQRVDLNNSSERATQKEENSLRDSLSHWM